MKIYTRTGDQGTTGLLGGIRVPKNDARIACCGSIDELNACLGVARAVGLPPEVDQLVLRLQHEMFVLGAELGSADGRAPGVDALDDGAVDCVERDIDRFDQALPSLRAFILPGGSRAGASLHVARCVCRRAERDLTTLSHVATIRPTLLQYVNRVSDLLFVLARAANAAAGVPDIEWKKA